MPSPLDDNRGQKYFIIEPRPFGLPRKTTVLQYRQDPVWFLSGYNYKISVEVGVSSKEMKRFLTVLDTGAGPNLIRAAAVPREFVEKARTSKKIVNIRSVTNHALDTVGILSLTVKVGDKTTRQPFVVVRNLVADVILGCTCIDAYVDSIHVRKSRVNLVNGSRLPIQRRPASLPSAELSRENPAILPRSSSVRTKYESRRK